MMNRIRTKTEARLLCIEVVQYIMKNEPFWFEITNHFQARVIGDN